MTRDEMIVFMEENPNVKITHTLFDSDEYIYQKEDGKVYDENGYLFDDWYSDRNNGVRMRTGGNWEDGWSVKEIDIKKIRGMEYIASIFHTKIIQNINEKMR